MTRPLLTAFASLLALCAPAMAQDARDASYRPPGDAPLSSSLVSTAVEIGQRYWAERDIAPCQSVSVRTAGDLSNGNYWDDAEGRAFIGGCTIWLNASLVRAAERRPGSDDAVSLCRTVTHELGHTAGLDHDHSDRVMDSAAEFTEGTPWGCRTWVKPFRKRAHAQRVAARKYQQRARARVRAAARDARNGA